MRKNNMITSPTNTKRKALLDFVSKRMTTDEYLEFSELLCDYLIELEEQLKPILKNVNEGEKQHDKS
jgi:hypothetical protein